MTRARLIIVLLAFCLITVFIPGCSGKKDSAAKKPEMSEQQKVPAELESMLTDLEKIIATLGKMMETEKKTIQMEPFGKSQEDQMQAKGNQGGQDKQSGKDASGQGQKQPGDGQASTDDEESSWQEVGKSLKNIHRNWNTLEPEVVKAGLGLSERNKFEQALDKLTLEISGQNKVSSLMAAIEQYGQYAQLAKVFKTPTPADFYQTKYEIMAASAEAASNDWPKAQERESNIKDYWNSLKMQAKVKDQKLLSRTDYSIEDLVQALKNKQLDTMIIKAEVAMNNLQQLEKDISSNNKSQ